MSCRLYRSFSSINIVFLFFHLLFYYLSAKILYFLIGSKRFGVIFTFLTKNKFDIYLILKIIKNDNIYNSIFAYYNYYIYLCTKNQKSEFNERRKEIYYGWFFSTSWKDSKECIGGL